MKSTPQIFRGARLLAVLLLLPVSLFAYTSPGKPLGFVTDFAQMLKPETVSSLNAELTDFSAKTTSEISVVTIDSLGTNDTIETYATKLFEDWKIGQQKQDNGVLLLISKNDRKVRIEVGYGLEPVITDIESSHIISDIITPAFKVGDYDAGVILAVHQLETDAINEYPATSQPSATHTVNLSFLSHFFYPLIFVFLFLGSWLGKSKSWWAGGVIGGIVAVVMGLFLGLVTGIIALVILIPLGLLFDYIASKHGGSGKGPFPPFFFGGGGFGGGKGFGGGGGFGGFSGGSSGGGGSSGSW